MPYAISFSFYLCLVIHSWLKAGVLASGRGVGNGECNAGGLCAVRMNLGTGFPNAPSFCSAKNPDATLFKRDEIVLSGA